MSFPLLPDDTNPTPDQDLDAAVQSALAIPTSPVPAPASAPAPFGMTWVFDFEAGQFVAPGSPVTTSGLGALEQWCLMAIHSARFAHAAFSDQFGMEGPDSPIGRLVTGEVLADWRRNVTEALLVHERVTSVENIDLSWDPTEGVLTVLSLDVVTDEDQTVTVNNVAVQLGGGLA